eukprot:SAG31_NODE_50462_length_113_cov_20.357143_1_plen_21_part_01
MEETYSDRFQKETAQKNVMAM